MSKATVVLRTGDSIIGKVLEQLPNECPTSTVGKLDIKKIVLKAGGEVTENISPVVRDEGNLRQFFIYIEGSQEGSSWEYPAVVYNFATGQIALHKSIKHIECDVALVNENLRPVDGHRIRIGTTIETDVVVMHDSMLEKIAGRMFGRKYEGVIKLLEFKAVKVILTDDREIDTKLTTGPSEDGPSHIHVVTTPFSRGAEAAILTLATIDMVTGRVQLHDGAIAIEGRLKFVNESE